MRTVFDIADRIYTIINTSAVKATINGSIYKNSQPEKIDNISSTQNIIINILSGINTPVGNTIANINIYVPDLSNGVPDDTKMKLIVAPIIAALDAYESIADFTFIDMDTIQNRIIRDDNNMSFLNLRFEVLTD
jgi:hypothetical protein